MDVHELTAGYALDALDRSERERFEEHLASCERCRAELQSFWEVTGGLARAAGGPPPPPSLRDRILEQARRERPNVVPLRRRNALPAVSTLATIAAAAAVALGLWAASLSRELDGARDELAVLEDPTAQTFTSEDDAATLVVTQQGEAVLVARTLPPAPAGKDYEIWVFEGETPRPAGLFERPGAARLTRRVEQGQSIAVTLERDGGVDAPTGAPILTATRS